MGETKESGLPKYLILGSLAGGIGAGTLGDSSVDLSVANVNLIAALEYLTLSLPVVAGITAPMLNREYRMQLANDYFNRNSIKDRLGELGNLTVIRYASMRAAVGCAYFDLLGYVAGGIISGM